uniref:Nodulin-like domain-containing protein n=1 Tax=Aegilops tauschii subsp. strangulata TaxID=200361 RepID=A0A453FWX9_AEGTS
ASGATYIFGIYSTTLKSSLGYNQQTLNTISFFKDLGANLGVFSGLLNEVTPPWVVLAIGATMNLVGYLMVYLAVDGRTARPPVWLVCLYIFIGANSQSFANTGALVTCVKNFPESRGIVLGILKGFVGLSGAVYTQLYLAFYGDDTKSLILLIAWLPAAISVVFVHTIRIMPYPRRRGGQETSGDPFFCFLYISIALACYLLVMIVVQKQFTFSHGAYSIAAAALLIVLFLPLCVVIKQEYKIYRERELDAALLANDPAAGIVGAAAVLFVLFRRVREEHVPAAGEGGGLHDPAGAGERGHAGAVRGDHLRRRRHADGDRQHGPDRAVAGVPGQEHQHLRVPHQHLELRRPRHVRLRLRGLAGAVQAAPHADAHRRAPAGLRRARPDRARGAAVALRGVRDHRVLLRRAVAARVRHHLRGVRAQVLLHAVQLRRHGQPRRVLHPERAGRRKALRRRGRQAARRRVQRGRRARQGVPGGGVLQAVVPDHHGGHRVRRAGVAGAGVEDVELLQGGHLREVPRRRRRETRRPPARRPRSEAGGGGVNPGQCHSTKVRTQKALQ